MARIALWLIGAAALTAAAGCASDDRSRMKAGATDARSPVSAREAAAAADAKESPSPTIQPATRISAAKMLESDGNLAAAAEQYSRILSADPRNIEAYTRLGIVYNRLQRFDDATRAFRRAIEIEPGKAYLHNNLGFCYVLQRKFAQAEASFRKALSIQPQYQRARMNLGAVLAETGRSDEAIAEFARVVSRDAAYYNLGLILASGQRRAGAEKAFRMSLALNPRSHDAAEQIARLERARRSGSTRERGSVVASVRSIPAPAALRVPTTQPRAGSDSSTSCGAASSVVRSGASSAAPPPVGPLSGSGTGVAVDP